VIRSSETRKVLGRFQEIEDERSDVKRYFADGSMFLVPRQLEFVVKIDEENGNIVGLFEEADDAESDETAPKDGNAMYLAFHDDSFYLSCHDYLFAVDIWGYFDAEHTLRREIFTGILIADHKGKYFQTEQNFSRDFLPGEEVKVIRKCQYGCYHCAS
jgi:hypothetical protein